MVEHARLLIGRPVSSSPPPVKFLTWLDERGRCTRSDLDAWNATHGEHH
ncbi:hypothetical protein [Actinoallomurus sp. NPDC050550]